MTARFVERANAFFQGRQLPLRLQKFSTMFFYDFHPDLKFASLLFYYLRDRGIHIWEGRVGHLSIAHTDEEMDRVLLAFEESVEKMQSAAFLPESASPAVMTMGPSTPSANAHGPGEKAGRAGYPLTRFVSPLQKPSVKCG